MTDRERIARAMESALGEDLRHVIDRVVKATEEIRADEREACAALAIVSSRQWGILRSMEGTHRAEEGRCIAEFIRARGAESKTGG